MLRLAKAADEASVKYDVRIILTLQPSDIYLLAGRRNTLLIFAQHMDPVPDDGETPILPEALKAAGAVGVILNHAEKPMTWLICPGQLDGRMKWAGFNGMCRLHPGGRGSCPSFSQYYRG